MLGIDVSNHQGQVDWRKVAADGVDFAWVKATEGDWFVDRYFTANLLGARQAGIKVGAYHYARPDSANSPEAEADYFLRLYTPRPGDLLPVLDYEVRAPLLSRVQMTEWALRWMELVRQGIGEQPVLYTYPYFLRDQMNVTALKGVKLWYADYTGKPGVLKYRSFTTGMDLVAQQYTSKGRVAGRYPVDMNWASSLGPLMYATKPKPKPGRKTKPLPGPAKKPKWFWAALKEYMRRRGV